MARLKTISTKAPERKVFTVSELNFRAKQILESELRQIWLEAEISNLTMASSGHWYFSLKDSKSQVSCAMFRGSNRMTTIQPKEGMKVLVRGRVSLYEPRGNYQLIVEQMSLAGEGDLLAKYEALKKQLSEEGLFDESIKQPIAPIYQTIGIISSPTGAAVHDVLSTIRRRFPLQQVVLYPSLVQGEQAVESIRGQLATAIDRNEVDVILLVRGGGAIEDLWCFNDERLARDIVACPIPIVSGIGHEVDFTIADFVADLRAATPTAAAEKTTSDQAQLMQNIASYKAWFRSTMQEQLQRYGQTLDWLTRQIKKPTDRIDSYSKEIVIRRTRLVNAIQRQIRDCSERISTQRLRVSSHDPRRRIQAYLARNGQLQQALQHQMTNRLVNAENVFKQSVIKLDNLSPLKVLSRGYSVTMKGDAVIDKAADVVEGDVITSRLHQGTIESIVKAVKPEDKKG